MQLLWWAYHIIELNKIVHKDQLVIHKKTMMIAGEAGVFILILLTGLYFTRRAILKELELAYEKKNFTLSVTHELKTPIASSKLFIETLIKRKLDRKQEIDILQKVYSDQNRLQQLVEGILLASKLDETNITLYNTPTNLYNLIYSTTQNMIGNQPITYSIPKELTINIDSFYFSSVIQNLHSNAVKYSPKDQPIIWEAETKNSNTIIRIKDHGKGIPKKERHNVFKLFYRIGNENTRKAKGTGLGLYLAQKIVQLHKGKIRIFDNTPKGTIIEIELPNQ